MGLRDRAGVSIPVIGILYPCHGCLALGVGYVMLMMYRSPWVHRDHGVPYRPVGREDLWMSCVSIRHISFFIQRLVCMLRFRVDLGFRV